MPSHPNLKTIRTIFLLFFTSVLFFTKAFAGQMTLPKTATVKDEIKISISNPDNKTLELVISSRSLKDPMIMPVPDDGEILLKGLSAGHYILGLREVGAKKYIEMSSLRIIEVLK